MPLCRSHLEKILSENPAKDPDDDDDDYNSNYGKDDDDDNDPSFSESISSLPEVNDTLTVLNDSLSSIKFQLRTPVDDMSDRTARTLKRKLM